MDFYDYQSLASRTAKEQDLFNGLVECALGLNGEAGELADQIKKIIYHGHDNNVDILVKEMGDCLWYLSRMSDLLKVSLEVVAKKNIEKLQERYPEGFSEERSRNRGEH